MEVRGDLIICQPEIETYHYISYFYTKQLLVDDKPISFALNRSSGLLIKPFMCVVKA